MIFVSNNENIPENSIYIVDYIHTINLKMVLSDILTQIQLIQDLKLLP